MRILAELLKRAPGVEVVSVKADGKWADGPELIDRADGVVLFASEGAKWAADDEKRLAALKRVQKRGGGLAVLHWGMGTKEAEPIRQFVALFGGCHGGPDRKYKVVQTTAQVASRHEATRGLGKSFEVKDEFYYRLKFPADGDGVKVTPLLRVTIDDEPHVVAWAAEAGKGRSFGFSGLHFHDNWKLSDYRRLVAQGVLWTLRQEVPKDGLDVTIDDKALRLR
jgi:type 1 glutamine amidotransferase